jgi:NADPH:quinone reductase-like Zn-dependent oxidoreductase
MNAARMHKTGGPSVLKYEEVKAPKPKRGEFLIEVRSAGVNPVDIKIRQGKFKLFKAALPAVIGRDIAGVVRAVGTKTAKGAKGSLKVGDSVFGMLDYDRGAYAGFTVASSREIARRPKGVTEREAGALGVAALTAWQGLFDHGKLKRGQRVLIHGAAGGVGHFAVQFAKVAGATVVATAAKQDLPWVRKLGADDVIDFQNSSFEEHTGSIDLVFDLVAGETQERSWGVLKEKGGSLVSTLTEPSKSEARRHHARAVRMVVKANRTQLEKIAALIAEGRVKVSIDKVFSLKEAAAAHAYLEKGHVRGKVLLHVPHSWIDPDPTEPKLVMTQEQELALYSGNSIAGVGPFF